ncbi:MAG: electron transfer flavoprotein subunit beta/FixA family protein, partial [Chitinophagales bacterium]
MNILVCICKTPDTTAKITFTDNNTKFDTTNVQWIMNPTDEWYALVRGIELKKQLGGTVTVVNVGLKDNDQIIRKALAIGADNAVRIDADASDAYFVASQIADYAKSAGFDIVFTGKETIDYNGFAVGGMLAEMLDVPYISMATQLEMEGTTATIDREIEGGTEKLKVNTPFVVSGQKGLAEQLIPNMRGIMMARRKPLKVVPAIEVETLSSITEYELPPQRSAVKLVDADNPAELVRLLHEEAKVI